MWVLRIGIGHVVFRDPARLRVELANEPRGVAGKPDVALPVFDKAMGSRARRLESVLFDVTRLQVEPPQRVGELTSPPNGAVPRRQRVVWARARRRNGPLLDEDLHRSRYHHSSGSRALRKILDQIVADRGPLAWLDRRLHVLHHADHGPPTLGGVANPDAIDVVTGPTGRGHDLFSGTVWEVLGCSGWATQQKHCSNREGRELVHRWTSQT